MKSRQLEITKYHYYSLLTKNAGASFKIIIINFHQKGKYSTPFLKGFFRSFLDNFLGSELNIFGPDPKDIFVSIKPAFIMRIENGLP